MKGQSSVKEDIIRQIYNFYNQHGRIVVRDLKSANNLPTIAAITYFWGSFQNCLRDLGIFQDSYCFNRKCKTDKQMLDELSVFYQQLFERTFVFTDRRSGGFMQRNK